MKFTSDVVIGLEIHVELDTQTKLFCNTPREGKEIPNTRVCPICLGHPGSKPVLNKKVVEYAIRLCLALGCKISKELIFSRKSYFYPDMSKNFQITQFEKPLGEDGMIKLSSDKEVKIKRVHIEEDPAALSYPNTMYSSDYVLIDYNRAGNPLLEIVTEPDMQSPEEARAFLNNLISILNYLGIFNINKCSIKSDANISIKESNYTRVEIKNISGFKELEKALNYELTRQRMFAKKKIQLKMETRGWDSISKTTKLLRTKETEADYGYIIEPDLSIVDITSNMVSSIKENLPELAQQKCERLIKQYRIDATDAWIISKDKNIADMYEKVAAAVDPQTAARWFRVELLRVLNYNDKTIHDVKFREHELIELLKMMLSNQISEKTAKKIMEIMVEKELSPKEYVAKEGLSKIDSKDNILAFCKQIIKENPKAVQDYKNGVTKSLYYLMGQLMRLTKGKADPKLCEKIMEEELKLHVHL